MNTEQVVIDDDDLIETVEIPDEDPVTQSSNDAIVIDLDEESTGKAETSKSDVSRSLNSMIDIELAVSNMDPNTVASEQELANLLKNNNLMSRIVEKCLNLEYSEGMTRVVHKSLVPAYKDTDVNFKKSMRLRKFLKRTLRCLNIDPDHKFSHIKALCDLLRSKKYKKKVPFITLTNDLESNCVQQVKKENNNTSQACQKYESTDINSTESPVIDLDNPGKDCTILDLDNDVVIVDEQQDNARIEITSDNSNKENNIFIPNSEILCNNLNYVPPNNIPSNIQIQSAIPNLNEEDNNLLLPQEQVIFTVATDNYTLAVKNIEEEIARFKKLINQLEQQEVTDYSIDSPYLKCNMMKARVVKLYEELCQLTGDDPVKRREVRLQVAEGYPPGPVKKLEEYLNNNIDSTGAPPFPDFCDVVNCVKEANVEDGLGWNKPRVMKEALALFTQCGHALRRRRQKREWRDLMSLVKQEEIEDPAEEDPQLLAKLEENKRIAVEKEDEILERFTQMERTPKASLSVPPDLAPRMSSTHGHEPFRNSSDTESASESDTYLPMNDNENNGVDSKNIVASNADFSPIGVNEATEKNDTVTSICIDKMDIEENTLSVVESSNVGNIEESVQIKQESVVDVQSQLDELGSNYTVTICDIEDPFLVIEISSDSSYSSDDDSEHKPMILTSHAPNF